MITSCSCQITSCSCRIWTRLSHFTSLHVSSRHYQLHHHGLQSRDRSVTDAYAVVFVGSVHANIGISATGRTRRTGYSALDLLIAVLAHKNDSKPERLNATLFREVLHCIAKAYNLDDFTRKSKLHQRLPCFLVLGVSQKRGNCRSQVDLQDMCRCQVCMSCAKIRTDMRTSLHPSIHSLYDEYYVANIAGSNDFARVPIAKRQLQGIYVSPACEWRFSCFPMEKSSSFRFLKTDLSTHGIMA